MDKILENLIEENWSKFRESCRMPLLCDAAKGFYIQGAEDIVETLKKKEYVVLSGGLVSTKCTCWRCLGLDKDPYEDEEEGGT